MPVLHEARPEADQLTDRRRRWTVEEAAKVAELFPGERYELIEGDIISKMGQKPPHVYVVRMIAAALATACGATRVQTQSTIRLPEPDGRYSEPEPDIVLLREHTPALFERLPGPEDIALLIEVADTSLTIDRGVKSRLYARAGIAEYWIVDISGRRMLVCREPLGEEYRTVTIVHGGEDAVPSEAPAFVFSLASVLP